MNVVDLLLLTTMSQRFALCPRETKGEGPVPSCKGCRPGQTQKHDERHAGAV